MSDLSRPGWKTFTPRAPQADVTLNLSPRYGTTVSQLEITVDQCGISAPESGIVKIRIPTNNYPYCKDTLSSIYVSRVPKGVPEDRVMGVQEADGSIAERYTLGMEVDFPGRTYAVVPASNSNPGEGWEAVVKVPGTAILTLEEDTAFTFPCRDATFRERIKTEMEVSGGILNYLGAIMTGHQHPDFIYIRTKNAIAGVKAPGRRQHHAVLNQSPGPKFTIDLRTPGWSKFRVDEGEVEITPTNSALRPFVLRAGQQAQVSATSVTGVTGNKDGAGSTVSIETETNRPGEDYRNVELSEPRPELCQAECAGDPTCKAFTYVRPGLQGPRARCWLKSTVPPAAPNPCCVSGVKRDASGGTPNPRYIGCYKDTSALDLNGFIERSQTNTPQRCIQTCAAKGFAYAAVQYGQSCLCGNSYGKYGPADNCNYKCTGDPNQICGGYSANSVFATR